MFGEYTCITRHSTKVKEMHISSTIKCFGCISSGSCQNPWGPGEEVRGACPSRDHPNPGERSGLGPGRPEAGSVYWTVGNHEGHQQRACKNSITDRNTGLSTSSAQSQEIHLALLFDKPIRNSVIHLYRSFQFNHRE